jgi:hypothetical protein
MVFNNFWLEWFNTPWELGREVFESYGYDKNGKLEGFRTFVIDYPSFYSYIQRMQKGSFPCWSSVLPFKARDQPSILEKLYFDFDNENNIEKAWLEAKNFILNIKRFYNAEALLCFSGNKGYNVYVWLKKPLTFSTESKLKQVYEKLQEILLKGIKHETLDLNPYGDIKRISRIPYSIHNKSASLCLPINKERNPLHLSNIRNYIDNGLTEHFVNFCLKKIEGDERELEEKRKRWIERDNQLWNADNRSIRPCVEAALKTELRKSDGSKMRLGIAREYIAAKYQIEEIVHLFASQNVFDVDITRARIEDLAKQETRPFRCKTIIKLGYCLKEGCALWRWKKGRGIEL